jgi:hypothetical protein
VSPTNKTPKASSPEPGDERDALESLEKVIQSTLEGQSYGPDSEALREQLDADVIKLELASYIQQMSHELSTMAKRSNMTVLSYFLDMAAAEARDVGTGLGQKLYAGATLGGNGAYPPTDKPRR